MISSGFLQSLHALITIFLFADSSLECTFVYAVLFHCGFPRLELILIDAFFCGVTQFVQHSTCHTLARFCTAVTLAGISSDLRKVLAWLADVFASSGFLGRVVSGCFHQLVGCRLCWCGLGIFSQLLFLSQVGHLLVHVVEKIIAHGLSSWCCESSRPWRAFDIGHWTLVVLLDVICGFCWRCFATGYCEI